MSPRTTTLRVILLHLIHYFFSFTSVRAQLLNVTVSPTRATFSGSWTCGVDGKGTTAFGSCGDTLRIAFEARLTSSIVIGIGLDGSQTRYTPQNTIAPGCYNDVLVGADLDPSRLHVISLTILAAAPGEAFIFGGMTATIDQSASSLTGNSTSNVPGKQPASPSEGDEHIGLIIGVIGGVLAFWLLAGLALFQVRRVRRSEMAQFQQMAIMTLDNSQAQTRTTVEPPTGQRGGASVPIRQLDSVQLIRATSSVSSYPATVDVPFPSGFVPVAPPPLPRSTAAAALDPSQNPFRDPSQPRTAPLTLTITTGNSASDAEPLTKWERELQVAQAKAGVNRARSGKRVHYRKRTLDDNEAGGTSAGGGSSAGPSTAPPLYTPDSAQYANGIPRTWV
ncbi:hypothetical protein BKA62DRAFT_738359 [Auriculariales sp. MPI-PUGE-AT-0066]|nr:hypothetical protein BKA62DRAFT_738359 [Auriculariales sp. MPI-PUGE-AT-0066]